MVIRKEPPIFLRSLFSGGLLTVSLPPTISVFGYKGSGKTIVITRIITHLVKQGRRVLSAKHIGEPEFSLDSPGTDSFRHLEAGAEATFLHSNASTALLLRQPIANLTQLLQYSISVVPAEVILLEGFRFWTQKDPNIAKIICVRTMEEVAEFQAETVSPILGQCTLDPDITSVIRIPDEFPFLLEAVDKWLLNAPSIPIGENE
ncbi:MAG: molybdopterin-guanine dinucleotide biosynthesis protein B [Promethearchaeota archaeon]